MYVCSCLCMHLGRHVPLACRYLPRTEEAVKDSGAGGGGYGLFCVGAIIHHSSLINASPMSSVDHAKGKGGCKV